MPVVTKESYAAYSSGLPGRLAQGNAEGVGDSLSVGGIGLWKGFGGIQALKSR